MVTKIRSLEKDYSMEMFYEEIGKSRQLYSKRLQSNKNRLETESKILSHVRNWRQDHPRMGSRILYHTMQESGIIIPIGITSFERLLSRKGMTVGTAKKSSPHTSDGLGKRNYPNLANGLTMNDINQLVVADITYFWVNDRWCYLFVMKDVYSQRLVSLVASEGMKAENAVKNLQELKQLRGVKALEGCIHHSDNGSQYEALIFKAELETLTMKISRGKSCQENGSCEQINHIIKNMYLTHFGIRTFSELKLACEKVKSLMNNKRAVQQLGNISVQKFERSLDLIPLAKREKKTLHDFNQT